MSAQQLGSYYDADQLCGAYADHVDHIVAWARFGLPPRKGSTARWRRIRRYVLDRDGWSCRVPVDDAGRLVDEQLPAELPQHPDDPTNLRAACARHNLQRGDRVEHAAPTPRRRPAAAQPWKW